VNRTALKVQLVKHEGLRLTPYRCTAGKLTIGVGRNLEDRGISEDEAAMLLDNDIMSVWKELSRVLPGFTSLDDTRQHVLMDMCFNLGTAGLLKFKAMLAAVEARDFDRAAAEMLDSAWARQVGKRAQTLAQMMKTGAA
jgi:lysozyme